MTGKGRDPGYELVARRLAIAMPPGGDVGACGPGVEKGFEFSTKGMTRVDGVLNEGTRGR